jgi:hypothetical protein
VFIMLGEEDSALTGQTIALLTKNREAHLEWICIYSLALWSRKMACSAPFKMPNNLRRCCKQCVEVCSLLSNKTQSLAMMQDPWWSGFLCGARMYPLHLLNPSTNLDLYKSTHSNCAFYPSWLIRFRHCWLHLQLALEFTVGWNINTGLWRPLFVVKGCQWRTVPI